MAKTPEPPQPLRWDIYRVASKGKLLGTVEADNAGEAVTKAAEEFSGESQGGGHGCACRHSMIVALRLR
jgi:hypothetical protein